MKLSENIMRILYKRGINIKDEKCLRKFFYPSIDDFYPSVLLPDAERAAQRLREAIKNREKILLHGDFDADGITSIALLYRFLTMNNVIPDLYIPHRIKEGYGISNTAILQAKTKGVSLMVAVDSGTTDFAQINFASSLGMDVIIMDHHIPKKKLPNAHSIVNPFRKDSKYPFPDLASAGIVFKILLLLADMLNISKEEVIKLLPIATIGTVADVMPLVDENRTIVKLGMEMFDTTEIKGIKTLMKISGIKNITSRAIGYGIGPRLNAAGRISTAEKSLRLLISDDEEEVANIAEELDSLNKKRQKIEAEILEQSMSIIDSMKEIPPVIVIEGQNWHEGVVGIVSSKITDYYGKPSIVISLKEETGRGSGRSIEGFDIFKAISQFEDHLIRFGGHSMAIGLSIEVNKIDEFKNKLYKYAETIDIPPPEIIIDDIVENIDIDFVNELELLKPFGEGNPEPLLCMRDVEILEFPRVLKNKHIKFSVRKNNKIYSAIGFNMVDKFSEIKCGKGTDIVFKCRKDNYRELIEISLQIKDFKETGDFKHLSL